MISIESMRKSPNILFILIDDLGWRDLSCFGSSFYETPNIDRLGRQGVRFTSAYASCPVCSPTRASILSGKYPARVGVTQFIGGSAYGKLKDVPYLHYLPREEISVAQALRESGYQTWHVGKWHLGDENFSPEVHGFDINIGGCHIGMPTQGYFSPYRIPKLDDGKEGEYLTDRLTEEALSLIRNRGERPFFLNLSHYAVHTPIQAPEALVEKYRNKAKKLRLDQIDPFLEGENFPVAHKVDQRIQRRVIQSDPVYAAMVENLDTNIGRILQGLEEEGISEETLVVFTSDNGGLSTAEGSPTCNHPLHEGKGWNYEGGTRVSQIVRWPGVTTPGTECRANVTSTDFYPTFLEAAGLPLRPEQHCDGLSLLPLLRGEADLPERDAIYWHYPHYGNQGGTPAASILMGSWKLIRYFEDERLELFNLNADISETCDLSVSHPEKRAELEARLNDWINSVEGLIPEANPDWPLQRERPVVPNNADI